MKFTDKEKLILAEIQHNLPLSLTPYADLAKKAGVREADVLDFLAELKKSGIIRRFGASLRHQKAGWQNNAMTVWAATEEQAEKYGPIAARHPQISHAYFRPSNIAGWPYTLYTMIHGKKNESCQKVIEELLESWPLKKYIILESVRELKKVSPVYF